MESSIWMTFHVPTLLVVVLLDSSYNTSALFRRAPLGKVTISTRLALLVKRIGTIRKS